MKLELERYWYWVLCDIRRYWLVLLLGNILTLWHPIQYRSDSGQKRPHDRHLDVCVDSRENGEEVKCKQVVLTLN